MRTLGNNLAFTSDPSFLSRDGKSWTRSQKEYFSNSLEKYTGATKKVYRCTFTKQDSGPTSSSILLPSYSAGKQRRKKNNLDRILLFPLLFFKSVSIRLYFLPSCCPFTSACLALALQSAAKPVSLASVCVCHVQSASRPAR